MYQPVVILLMALDVNDVRYVMVSRESHNFQLFSNAVSSMQLDDIFSHPKLENE